MRVLRSYRTSTRSRSRPDRAGASASVGAALGQPGSPRRARRCARPTSPRSTRREARRPTSVRRRWWGRGITGDRRPDRDPRHGGRRSSPGSRRSRLPPLVRTAPRRQGRRRPGLQRRWLCAPAGAADGHGHGTHVAGIAAGTGEGTPLATDDGKYAGIAPGAELAAGKVLTDAGAGINSDLLAAMEWAAMPAEDLLTGCAVGADIVNMSLGSEARPDRLNSGSDIDLVSLMLNRLTVRYGTLFVVAAREQRAVHRQRAGGARVGVTGAQRRRPRRRTTTSTTTTRCRATPAPAGGIPVRRQHLRAGVGDQPPSIASFSSRGPSGDVWLRPDLARARVRHRLRAGQHRSRSSPATTQTAARARDPLYATAIGHVDGRAGRGGERRARARGLPRSGTAATPSGSSGSPGLTAPAYALLRAAMMNSAARRPVRVALDPVHRSRGHARLPARARSAAFEFCDFIDAFRAMLGNDVSTRSATAPRIRTSGRSPREPAR